MIRYDDTMRPKKTSSGEYPARYSSPFKGHQVDVVVGWAIETDRYVAHAYVTRGDTKAREKVPLEGDFATETEAAQAAFKAAEWWTQQK